MTPAVSTILVPTDFSAGSRLALHYALQLARQLGASVHVLHVIEDTAIAGMWAESYVDFPELRKERRCAARRLMNELLDPLHAGDCTDEITSGPVARTITATAVDRGTDVIVMGTHGRTGLAHALVGSIAEQVMRTAGCPVLTLREGAAAAWHPHGDDGPPRRHSYAGSADRNLRHD